MINPVLRNLHKRSRIFLIPGHLIRLTERHEKAVSVELPDKFRIVCRHIRPVDRSVKLYRLVGLLQIPLGVEQKIFPAHTVRHRKRLRDIFWKLLPAVRPDRFSILTVIV